MGFRTRASYKMWTRMISKWRLCTEKEQTDFFYYCLKMPSGIFTAILLFIFGNQVMMGVGIFNCHKQSGKLSFVTISVKKYTTEFTVSLCSGLKSLKLINILEFNILILAIITFVITTTACHYHNKVRCHYHIDVKIHGKILHLMIISIFFKCTEC